MGAMQKLCASAGEPYDRFRMKQELPPLLNGLLPRPVHGLLPALWEAPTCPVRIVASDRGTSPLAE